MDHDEAFKSFDLETFVNKDLVQHMYKLNEAPYYPDASTAMLENRYLTEANECKGTSLPK